MGSFDAPSFSTFYTQLRGYPAPLGPPGKARDPHLTARIAALGIHPTLEAVLHLLNLDLPSAHFLVRHMAAAPAFEGMFLHGILHRIEGDYDNARAWYTNVCDSELLGKVWGGKDNGIAFIDRVEAWIKDKDGDEPTLEKESAREIDTIVTWCTRKFGTEGWVDVSGEWVRQNDKSRKIAEAQITGDTRRFAK
ncbi:MAG: hypothetical protein M1837_004304 [Sclerophora amabilis]|nr:MAG: hypothetical protein M1837_004304 [Sclerophora amabilis]